MNEIKSSRPPAAVAAAAAVASIGLVVGLWWLLSGDDASDDEATQPESSAEDPSGSDGDGAGETAGGGDPAAISPTFEEGSCRFTVPADTSPRCGTVTVPMNWDTGEGEIVLAVAVFPSTSSEPAADPVVYLEGGPGGHALDTIEFTVDDLVEPLRARGDVVFFDQRGVGLSEPRLHCDEVTALDRELEDTPDIDADEIDARYLDAYAACSARLSGQGIDLGQFNTINNAHDVEAIRLALGYDEWNLHGISYGTKLGLEVMRQHPDGVRSVVLDSVFPSQVDPVADTPGSIIDSYEAVVVACGQEPECAAGGELDARLRDVAQALDAEPVQVEIQELTGGTDEVYANGETIVGLVVQSLYYPEGFTDLPELVAELESGQTGALEQFLTLDRFNEPFLSTGMFLAVTCNEEVAHADPAAAAAAVPVDPFGRLETFDYASNAGPRAFETCEAFGSVPAPAESTEAVTSDIPTLLMAGAFDPVTPVSWAEAAAETLPNSFLVEAPFQAHGVSPGECGMAVVVQFLDDPGQEPDASCFSGGELSFVGPPDGEVVLEEVTLDYGGASLSTVRPEDWQHGQLPGDSYRQASILDVTQLVQVIGDRALVVNLEAVLFQTWGIEVSSPEARDGLYGRDWQYRNGQSSEAAVEWYETEIGGLTTFVVLVSAPAELESNVESVLVPVLEVIDAA
jgi:pimeloyl-ACP methyl ester carboxylesterase